MRPKFAPLLALLLFVIGCGGGRKNSSTSGVLSGNWQMSLQSSNANLKPYQQSGFLVQNGDTVTGNVLIADNPCSGVGTVNGTVSGSSVSLAITPAAIEVDLTGSLSSTPGYMSGTFTILSSGCTASGTAPESGTWAASLVSPLNGNIQGTFTSKNLTTPITVTGQISQGANTGIINAALSGNITFSNYCVASTDITGVVSGTSVVLSLVNSDGTQVGQVTGTTSLDGTAFTGTYNILSQGSGAAIPCRGGDSGTVTFTL